MPHKAAAAPAHGLDPVLADLAAQPRDDEPGRRPAAPRPEGLVPPALTSSPIRNHPRKENIIRCLLFAASGLAMLTGLAVAQEQPQLPPPAPMEAGQADAGAPPPPPPGPGRHGQRGPRGGRDGERPPPPSKAAHIRLEMGDLKLDLKCADDEPMKTCSDIALQLFDKVASKP